MGSGSKKKKGAIDMGKPSMDPELWKAYRWCVRNQIAIAPKAYSPTQWYIDIRSKDRTQTIHPSRASNRNQSPEQHPP